MRCLHQGARKLKYLALTRCPGVASAQAREAAANTDNQLFVQREIDGRTYYEFEFATKAKTYIRHALAVVTVANGNCSH